MLYAGKNWIECKDYIENLGDLPDSGNINLVEDLAQNHDHWIVRIEAVNYLGRLKLSEAALLEIFRMDSHPSVRMQAIAWLGDYDNELLKYQLKHDTSKPLGQSWNVLQQPVVAVVAAIDPGSSYRIGLSAMQMTNLDVQRRSERLDKKSLGRVVLANMLGMDDGQDFGRIVVHNCGREVVVDVYNVMGNSAIGGAGIRISSALASHLKLSRGDEVELIMES